MNLKLGVDDIETLLSDNGLSVTLCSNIKKVVATLSWTNCGENVW